MKYITPAVLLGALLTAVPATAQQVRDQGAFTIRVGGDSFGVETFSRNADTLRGTLIAKGQPRIEYVAVLGPPSKAQHLRLTIYPNGIGDSTHQTTDVTVDHDSAIVESAGRRVASAVRPGTVPIFGSSFAMMEALGQRARMTGTDMSIPLLINGTTPGTGTIHSIASDSMSFTIASIAVLFATDAKGRILTASVPAQGVTVTRDGVNPPASAPQKPADYSPPPGAPYRAVDVSVSGQRGIKLTGTLTLPTTGHAPYPAVVTITGSGQEDRDELIPFAGGIRLYRAVADTLGRRGIAVLRLDDRLVGGSEGPLGTTADYADDIRGAVAFLHRRPEIDSTRIGLIGHSEGGEIAPIVAATDPTLRGIVLLAGPGRTGRETVMDQNRDAINSAAGLNQHARDSIMAGVPAAIDAYARTNAWYSYFLQYDPIPTARKVKTPVLIVQGLTDHQVAPGDAPLLAAAFRAGGNRDVTVRTIPNVNHLFVADTNGAFSGYAKLTDNRISKVALGALADWFATHLH